MLRSPHHTRQIIDQTINPADSHRLINKFQKLLKYTPPSSPLFTPVELTPHKIDRHLISVKDQKLINEPTKPNFSYTQIIMEALAAHNNIAMLNEIYKYFEETYPYYKNNISKEKWKGNIRHNLSLCKMFKRVSSGKKEGKKGAYWCYSDENI
ncbi:Forkhead box protein J2 [Cucumispora dikerogammari]|nr:Forkhead box protein J2 [Cucumispora dikerogammari]